MYFYGLIMHGNSVYKPLIRFFEESDEAASEHASYIKERSGNYRLSLVKYKGYRRKNGRLVIRECLDSKDW
jgi:hypothetical protein